MISIKDLYNVLSAMVPLYVAMILAYGSVRWWKIFTPVQCAGINRFVAVFAVPLLSFHFISSNNPYKMDGPFILADSVAKLAIFVVLAAWARFSRNGSLDWLITLFSVATLPNTLVMGIPLLEAMYGRYYGDLMVQLVVLQCIVWYTLLLFLFELRAARLLVMEQFPDTAASIVSFKVDSDIVSLDGREPLETRADMRDDGKIRVTIRRSISSRSQALNSFTSARRSLGLASMPSSKAITPRPSNLTGADIHSFHSSRNNPRDPSSIHPDIYSLTSTRAASPRQSNFTSSDVYSVQSSHGPTPRPSNVNEDNYRELHAGARATSSARLQPPSYGPTNHPLAARNQGQKGMAFLAENHGGLQSCPGVYGAGWNGYVSTNAGEFSPRASKTTKKILDPKASPRLEDGGKELHMFVWSSTASPASEGGLHVFGGSDFGVTDSSRPANEPKEVRVHVLPSNEQTVNRDVQDPPMHPAAPHATYVRENFSLGSRAKFPEDTSSPVEKNRQNVSKSSTAAPSPKAPNREKPKDMPPPTVLLKLILKMVGRKLLHNPNTYSSLIGVLWALIAFRWNVSMPQIVSGSIKILSDAGLGMAMFSLGLFMALQPRLIACGTALASFAMAVRFLTGPAVMAASSMALGLRGVHLHAAIVQASLPQGIVPFVFAREYDLHPDILSTAVIFGMLIALPITLLYYVFLGL